MIAEESRKDEIRSKCNNVWSMASCQSGPEEAVVSSMAGADTVQDSFDDDQEIPAPQQDPHEEMPTRE